MHHDFVSFYIIVKFELKLETLRHFVMETGRILIETMKSCRKFYSLEFLVRLKLDLLCKSNFNLFQKTNEILKDFI